MATLRSRRRHYVFVLFRVFSFFFLALSQRSQIGCLPYFYTWCGPSADLKCRSQMYCMRLAENTGRKNDVKNRHLSTIAQLCRAVSSQLRHLSTIGRNLLSSNISSTYPHNVVRPTNGWDQFGSLGHPCKFQLVSRLGSVTAQHSSSGRQPNFAALNRGRHLYSAGQTSRWALGPHSSCNFCSS